MINHKKAPRKTQDLWNLAGVAGLEPATVGFGDRCSTNWNYTPVDHTHYAKTVLKGKGLFKVRLSECSFFNQINSLIPLFGFE